ncbi:unnamed protein product [Darwinula stevensoni]|uniref:Uncharacterized protein n=1 Tax=Darwinula stevensoni TaxID=69355 RepID=A0A7R8XIY7_9CRUS|nr:unnamed protein product [Darwinula stevensoni]CAG0891714.1 unnamed protein product [Darwinula stevensoni]
MRCLTLMIILRLGVIAQEDPALSRKEQHERERERRKLGRIETIKEQLLLSLGMRHPPRNVPNITDSEQWRKMEEVLKEVGVENPPPPPPSPVLAEKIQSFYPLCNSGGESEEEWDMPLHFDLSSALVSLPSIEVKVEKSAGIGALGVQELDGMAAHDTYFDDEKLGGTARLPGSDPAGDRFLRPTGRPLASLRPQELLRSFR